MDPQSAHAHAWFGNEILTALTWAARQRKTVAKTCVASQRNTVFGEQAGEDEIENIDDFVGKLYAYLVSFTTDAPDRIVRNSGEGNGLETTAQRVRSDIIHETCGDPLASSEPSSMPTCRRLGTCSCRSRIHRVVSESRISDQHWKNGFQRNIIVRHSRTRTDGPAKHPTTVLWRPCSG